MPSWRRRGKTNNSAGASVLSLNDVRRVIGAAIAPAHFFVTTALRLEWQHCPFEEIPWEIYQGRLLDSAHTRLRHTFESWNIHSIESDIRSAEPILSLKLDAGTRQLHVTRAIHSYAWEGYHAGDNVYLSRETCKWVRELVGTIPLDPFSGADDLLDEIICLLFQAVVGCSRLPLQSVEAPLPAYALGNLAYFFRARIEPGSPQGVPLQLSDDLIEHGLHDDLAGPEKAKLLESVLRGTAPRELDAAAERFVSRWRALGYSSAEFNTLCRTLFNEVSLSPYTDFVDKTIQFLKFLVSRRALSTEAFADFLGYLLRQNARHLTGYDLITFHHQGANYPDALLLDTVLKAYLELIENQPGLFLCSTEDDAHADKAKRFRRRALRQAWLMRRTYEGLPVPDQPTSPGENSRVLPASYPRVPEEQIVDLAKRTKRLFEGEPLLLPGEPSRQVMVQCLSDLRHPGELQELGMAVFLDRPLGVFKSTAEPDRTLLLSYETFSPSIALKRLDILAKDSALNLSLEALADFKRSLADSPMKGIPIPLTKKRQKPAAVALQDAAKVANDFTVLRTTRLAVQDFLEQFDCTQLAKRLSLDYLDSRKRTLIVSASAIRSGPADIVDIYDASLRRRLELRIDPARGYRCRARQEYPVAGLRVLRAWQEVGSGVDLREHVLEGEGIVLSPRE